MIHDACPHLCLPDATNHRSQAGSASVAISRSESIEGRPQLPFQSNRCWLWIAPHDIGFDGFFWHARDLRLTDLSFKDSLLLRVIEARGTKPIKAEPEIGADRAKQVTLETRLHPGLPKMQQQVIALYCRMRSERAMISVLKTLLCYALKWLGLDTDPDARPPQDQLIVLLNRQAVVGKRNAVGSHQELS